MARGPIERDCKAGRPCEAFAGLQAMQIQRPVRRAVAGKKSQGQQPPHSLQVAWCTVWVSALRSDAPCVQGIHFLVDRGHCMAEKASCGFAVAQAWHLRSEALPLPRLKTLILQVAMKTRFLFAKLVLNHAVGGQGPSLKNRSQFDGRSRQGPSKRTLLKPVSVHIDRIRNHIKSD